MHKIYVLVILALLMGALFSTEELQLVGTMNYPQISDRAASFADWLLIKGLDQLGDVNNDGYDDFLYPIIHGNSFDIAVWYGGHTISNEPDEIINVQSNPPMQAAISWRSDINGDSISDLIINKHTPVHSTAFFTYGIFTNDMGHDETFSFSPTNRYDLYLPGDINGDGIEDIVAHSENTDDYIGHVWIKFGSNSISPGVDIDIAGNEDWEILENNYSVGRHVFAGDVNGDGINDLFYSKFTNQVMEYKLLLGGSNIGANEIDFTSNIWNGMADGDFNGDGFNDVVANNQTMDLLIYYGSPDNTLRSETICTNSSKSRYQYTHMFYSDVNTDGYDDIVVEDMSSQNILIYLGGNQLNDQPDYTIPMSDEIEYFRGIGMDAGDMNGDGYNDIILNYGGDSSILQIWSLLPVSNNENVQQVVNEVSNYPNPFNYQTVFKTNGSINQLKEIQIFNIRGELVRTLDTSKGNVHWDGCDKSGKSMSAGIYFYRNISEYGVSNSKKMLKIK